MTVFSTVHGLQRQCVHSIGIVMFYLTVGQINPDSTNQAILGLICQN